MITVRQLPLPDSVASDLLLQAVVARPPVIAPRVVDRPLVLYGAGNLGRMAKAYFDRLGVPVVAVVDIDIAAAQVDPCWQGMALFSADQVPPSLQREAMLAVCIATLPYAPIEQKLRADGWCDLVPFYDICEAYRERHPLGNGWFSGPLEDDSAHIVDMLGCWSDDVSRAHHLQFIAWHTIREEWRFEGAPVTTGDRYFIPELLSLLGRDETLLDVGAHLGEVSRQWLERFGDVASITMIEADPVNFESCARLADEDERISARNLVVSENSGMAAFSAGLGYASQLDPRGGDEMEVMRLDDLDIKTVSYLKLHLEGSELAVLKGAKNMLRSHRPIVAATAYHNRLGLWALPAWLSEQLADYRLLFRLHSWCGTGAVVYAIPEERWNQDMKR